MKKMFHRANLAILALVIFTFSRVHAVPASVDTSTLVALPPEANWNMIINFRPVSNEVVNFNPPLFSWDYVPSSPLDTALDVNEYNFVFQISYDNTFANPVVNVNTPFNFYNFLAPLANTNGTIYWRVGYVSAASNSTNAWVTNTFQIAGTATNWDRSMMADQNYLTQHAAHPHMLFNSANKSGLYNWLNTNQDPTVSYNWRNMQSMAANAYTLSFWTNGFQTLNDIALANEYLPCVAFMWQMTGNPAWTNHHPEIVISNYWQYYMANYWDEQDQVSIDPPPYFMGMVYAYDWFYPLLSPGTVALVLTNMHNEAVFQRDVGWWRKSASFSEGSTPMVTTRQYPGPYNVYYYSEAKGANTHGHQNFEGGFPMYMAAYGDGDAAVSNLFVLGANYLLSTAFATGHDGGPNQGRGYNFTEQFEYNDFTWYNALMLGSVFPDFHVENNPAFHRTAQFYEMQVPVGFLECNDPWGERGIGTLTYINPFCFDLSRFGTGGHIADLTGDPNAELWYQNNAALFGFDNYGYSPDQFCVQYFYPPPAPAVDNTLARAWLEDGWVIGNSIPTSQPNAFKNGVGFVFQARPKGGQCSDSDGHSLFSDLSYQIWAYGAAVTDGGDGSYVQYSHVSWAHYSLCVNGMGQYQNPDEPTHPYYARILAFTNAPDYTYCAADGTECYPVDVRNEGIDHALGCPVAYANLAVTNPPLSFLKGVQRQLLFQHHRYFVVYDTLTGTSNVTYSMLYHILEPTMANLNGGSFTYTVTNQWTGGNPVTVYVAQMVPPSALNVIDLTGTNVQSNPFTGENEWGDGGSSVMPRHDALWISNKNRTNNFHFMTVIYPVAPGGTVPTITTLDDSTVSITDNGTNDVISFNPQSPNISQVNFLVNSPAIVATGGADPIALGTSPSPYGSVLLAGNMLDGAEVSGGSTVQVSTPTGLPPSSHGWVVSPMSANQMNSFTPVPGYVAWWNPDTLGTWNGSPSSTPGSLVSSWVDSSPNGFTAVQATPANQPQLQVQGQNGHNLLYFNGSSSFLRWASTNVIAEPLEVFMVEQEAYPTAHSVEVFLMSDKSSNHRPWELLDGHQNYFGSFIESVVGANLISADNTDGGYAATNLYVLTALLSGTNSQIWTNGVSAVTGSMATTGTIQGLDFGANNTGAQNLWGWMGDVIVYNRQLSPTEQQAVENGLRTKYGF
jgi:hypothetical protein